MKWSRYNYIYKKDNKIYILYNYAFDTVIFILKDLIDIVIESKENIDDLAFIHPDLYKKLLKKKFLVNEDIEEEVEELKNLNMRLQYPTFFKLTINPTLDCNLRCWYCYETHIAKSCLNQNIYEEIKKLITRISRKAELRTIDLTFFGGEPLYRSKEKILSLIRFTKKNCSENNKELHIQFTTNGVLFNKTFVQNLTKISTNISIQVPFDDGKEEHNKVKNFSNGRGSYDIILNNLDNILKSGIKVNIRCNYTKENIDSYKNLIIDIDNRFGKYKKQMTFQMQKIWQVDADVNLEKSLTRIKNFLVEKSFTNNLIGSGSISSYCYADYDNSMVINYNGDIFKCTARDFKKTNRVGILRKDGSVLYEDRYKRRLEYRFNKECKNCTILPICTICSQARFESGNKDKCPLEISEKDKKGQIAYRLKALCYKYL